MIADTHKVAVDPESLFDVQVKRIHEYKRQLLNALGIVARYVRLREGRGGDLVPRTSVFAGKAAPGYGTAKLIIRFINDIARTVNADPVVGERLRVVFLANYNVSLAEVVMPAAELSEQISTAGTEASGTGNMKLALNGALTIGTRDGANIEIAEEVGEDNLFFFGLTAEEVTAHRDTGYRPQDAIARNPELGHVLDLIAGGHFSPGERDRYRPLVDLLTRLGDHYLLTADYADYVACQDRVEALYRDPDAWTAKAVLNTARMGRFSSDLTIRGYARDVWGVSPLPEYR